MEPWAIAVVVIIIVIIAAGAGCGFYWAKTLKKFKKYQVNIVNAKEGIVSSVNKRFALSGKMFDITKPYLEYGEKTFAEIMQTEGGFKSEVSIKSLSVINYRLDQLAHDVDVVFEKNPNLKSDKSFLEQQALARDCEEHLQALRRIYNSNVKEYNQLLSVFPASLISVHYKFVKEDFFGTEEKTRSGAKVGI